MWSERWNIYWRNFRSRWSVWIIVTRDTASSAYHQHNLQPTHPSRAVDAWADGLDERAECRADSTWGEAQAAYRPLPWITRPSHPHKGENTGEGVPGNVHECVYYVCTCVTSAGDKQRVSMSVNKLNLDDEYSMVQTIWKANMNAWVRHYIKRRWWFYRAQIDGIDHLFLVSDL